MSLDPEPQLPELPAAEEPKLANLLRQSDEPPWTAWDLAIVILVFVVALFAASGVAIYLPRPRPILLDEYLIQARVMVPVQMAGYLAALAAIYLIARFSYRRPLGRAIEWNWPGTRLALLALVAGAPLALILQAVQSRLPLPPSVPMEKFFRTPSDVYLMAVLALAAAPLMEEFFFRGLLYPVLRRRGAAVGVILTAIAFALVHGSQYGWAWSAMLVLTVVGIVLTLARALLRSVAASFLLHFGYNLTLFVVLFLSTDRFHHLQRGP